MDIVERINKELITLKTDLENLKIIENRYSPPYSASTCWLQTRIKKDIRNLNAKLRRFR